MEAREYLVALIKGGVAPCFLHLAGTSESVGDIVFGADTHPADGGAVPRTLYVVPFFGGNTAGGGVDGERTKFRGEIVGQRALRQPVRKKRRTFGCKHISKCTRGTTQKG